MDALATYLQVSAYAFQIVLLIGGVLGVRLIRKEWKACAPGPWFWWRQQ